MRQVIHSFDIESVRFIDQEGHPLGALPSFTQDRALMVSLYHHMLLTRRVDAKIVAMQRTGQMGTYPSSLGQEAVGVGVASAMIHEDVLVPDYRSQSALLYRGMPLERLMLFWGGDERGNNGEGSPPHDFPINTDVASQTLHAAGAAYALKCGGKERAAVTLLGDGATSKGDFYESLSFASVFNLPLVFIVANNGWAISVPLEKQTRAQTLAQKGIAVNMRSVQVDGNDVVAVRDVALEALSQARTGHGPTLIEAVTYRMSDHTTADDARRYRPPEVVREHWEKDPVKRTRGFLVEHHGWNKNDEISLLKEIDARLEKAVASYTSTPPLSSDSLFDHLYAQPVGGEE